MCFGNCLNPRETKIGSFLLLWPGVCGTIEILFGMGELANKVKQSKRMQGDIGRKFELQYCLKSRCLGLCLITNIGPLRHRIGIR